MKKYLSIGEGVKAYVRLRNEGKCPFCEKDMNDPTNRVFRDELSAKEFHISGMCQSCQDSTEAMFKKIEEEDDK